MKKRITALALCILMLCFYSAQAIASDSLPKTEPKSDILEMTEVENMNESGTEPYGWDGTTEADYNKDDATPVLGSYSEPSEIVPYSTKPGKWVQSSNGKWWFRFDDGTYPYSAWEYINGYWYYFDASGWMVTGWVTYKGDKFYLQSNGAMATGWRQIGAYWYYFYANGAMVTGPEYLSYSGGEGWFYFYSDGKMATSNISITESDSGNLTTWVYYIQSNGVWLYTTSVQIWNLYDSTRHVDYTVDSTYAGLVSSAAAKWNAYKSGVLRESTSGIDLTIYDYYDTDTTARAVTNSAGKMRINTYRLQQTAYANNLKTITHEFGHALGLGHNSEYDVMYRSSSTVTTLTTSDKRSYDRAYAG